MLQEAPTPWGLIARSHRHCTTVLRMGFPSGRLTAQWSVEDEEEAARERRRREREKQLRSQAEEGLNDTGSCSESAGPAQENQ